MHLSTTRTWRRWLGAALMALGLGLLGACAHAPVPGNIAPLLHDELYPGLPESASAETVFAMSPGMLRYVDERLSSLAAQRDLRRALLEALYSDGELRLFYDGIETRNAAQAFEARAGNCLSLVIMTAAFAKHLGLPVSYRNVLIEDSYTRSGDLVLVSGHVNLVLGRTTRRSAFTWSASEDWTIDFVPGANLRGQRTSSLNEDTVVAMYFNNRAAEMLASGRSREAYAWARSAVRADPDFLPAINTLAVLYLRDGHHAAAEATLQHVLAREPDSASALTNLALLMQRTQRHAQARLLLERVAKLLPDDPYTLFQRQHQTAERGDKASKLERLREAQAN